LIRRYQRTVNDNRTRLRNAVAALNRLAPRRKVVWGAGRLFDSLVTIGGLDPASLTAVVDSHLGRYVASVHGRPVVEPDRLASLQPDLVVIASRAYYAEIHRRVGELVPGCPTLGFAELLNAPAEVRLRPSSVPRSPQASAGRT
jgi:hypothetical protein